MNEQNPITINVSSDKKENFIKYIFTKFSKGTIFWFLVCLILAILLGVNRCTLDTFRQKSKELNQNIIAMSKEKEILKNVNGELYSSKAVLALDIKNLELINKKLATEVKKYKGIVMSVSDIDITSDDTVTQILIVKDTVYKNVSDTTMYHIRLDWSNDKQSRYDNGDMIFIRGITNMDIKDNKTFNVDSKITKSLVKLNVKTGLITNESGEIITFVRSDNPNVSFDFVSNVDPEIFIKDKTKRWGVGVFLGSGMSYGIVGQNTGQSAVAIVLGVGITYSFFNF